MRIFAVYPVSVAFVLFFALSAHSETFTNTTRCEALNDLMAKNDPSLMLPSLRYIFNVMTELDDDDVARGGSSILRPLSREGRINMVSMTAVHCSNNPEITVRSSAEFVYIGTRGMSEDLGVARGPRK